MPQARIAIDAMGGDQAPRATVLGTLQALGSDPDLHAILVGDEAAISEILDESDHAAVASRLSVRHASQVVGPGDSPKLALRLEDASIKRAAELVRAGEADGLVAAGNTGAAVAAGTLIVGLIDGVRRPGIAVSLPTATGVSVLCDAGANIHCKPLHLFHYGIMAAQYAQRSFGIENPSVGLLNIGSEDGKGTELHKETARLFGDSSVPLNYVGNVEGNDVFSGRCDVIVCEGFVGNVVLKTAEGLYEVIAGKIRGMMGELGSALGAVAPEAPGVLENAFGRMKGRMDWADHGGAPLLGLNGLVLISHGRSDERAIKNAMLQASRFHQNEVLTAMVADVARSAT